MKTYEAVVPTRNERVQLVKKDDTRRRRTRPRKHLSHRPLALTNILHTHTAHQESAHHPPSRRNNRRAKEGRRTLFNNSGPFTLTKFAPLSLATAFASNVFPHPGGPHINTPHGASIPTLLNTSGLLIGCTTAICNSLLIPWRAPMSDQDTLGTVVKPSRREEGWICERARWKSEEVRWRGESCEGVRGEGWVWRKWAIEEAVGREERVGRVRRVGNGAEGGVVDGAAPVSTPSEGSTCITTSSPAPSISPTSPSFPSTSKSTSGITIVPSEIPLNILLTAMIPAAPVNAVKSAPTYPGVAFANAVKSKSPSRRSLEQRTLRILRVQSHPTVSGSSTQCNQIVCRGSLAAGQPK